MKKDRGDTQSMTSSHHCFGFGGAPNGSMTSLNFTKSTISLFPTDECKPPNHEGSQTRNTKQHEQNGMVKGEERDVDIKRNTLGVHGSEKMKTPQSQEAETKNNSFMSFLRRGFSARNRRRVKQPSNNESSAFEALRSASNMHSEFSKYMALEKASADCLRPPSQSGPLSSQTSGGGASVNEANQLDPNRVNDNRIQCYGHSTERPPRPAQTTPKASHHVTHILPSYRTYEQGSSQHIQQPCTPTNPPRHEVFVRRPRTPTLGRAALLVRASYTNLDYGTRQLDIFPEQIPSQHSQAIWAGIEDVHTQSSGMSRSSSVNCDMKEKLNLHVGNLGCSSSTLTNSPKTRPGTLHSQPPTTTCSPVKDEAPTNRKLNRHRPHHAYDTVPLESLQTTVQPTGTSISVQSHQLVTPSGIVTNISVVSGYPQQLDSPWERPKSIIFLPACTEQQQGRESKTSQEEPPSFEHRSVVLNGNSTIVNNPAVSYDSQPELQIAIPRKKKEALPNLVKSTKGTRTRRSKLPVPCRDKPQILPTRDAQGVGRNHSFELQPLLPSQAMLKPRTDSTLTGPSKITNSGDPNVTRSNTLLQESANKQPRKLISLNRQNLEIHPAMRYKHTTDQRPTNQSVQPEPPAGSNKLRKRAKPELENARYRDISLKLSVQEVKNVTAKGRYFCEICLDRTLYARTTSKQSDGTVFWGEKFELNNLPEISIITINLYRQGAALVKDKRQRSKGQNQFVAFVTIPITDLSQSLEHQQWLEMRSPHGAPHMVNLENWQDTGNGGGSESRRLSSNSNSPSGARFRKRSMPVTCFRPPSSSPAFHETERNSTAEKSKSIGKKKRSWTAGVTSSPDAMSAKGSGVQSTKSSSASNSPTYFSKNTVFTLMETPIPQLRLNVLYEAIDVLPLDCYDEFQELLKTHTIDIIRFLEPKLSAKQKEELASCIVNIHEKVSNLSVADLLAELVRLEIVEHDNQSMLLRANSMASKAIECYIKLVGTEYLHRILKGPIDQLLASAEDFEVDPHRIKIPESCNISINAQVERNKTALLNQVSIIWNRIVENVKRIPYELREVFSVLRCLFEQTLGPQIAIQLISSCLFLRFICPAIHGPVLFGLTSSIPESAKVSRNLTLLAKVLQNLANMILFEEKEVHMKIFNPFMEEQIPMMREFLESISSSDIDDEDDSSYSDCHHYIDLGYEFAKLASVLTKHIQDKEVPSELSKLPVVLTFIYEHTTDTVLSSWAPDMVACRRFASCGDATSQAQSLSNYRQKYTSIESVRPAPLPNRCQQTPRVQSGSMQALNPKSINCFTETTEPVRYDNQISASPSMQSTNDVSLHDNHQSYGEQVNETGSVSTWPEEDDPIAVHSDANVETMENLISQYREQLSQLNACIEQVESISLATKPVSVKKLAVGEAHSTSLSSCTVSETAVNPMDINGTKDSAFLLPPAHQVRRHNATINIEASDYEFGDDEPDVDHGHCRSEPVKFRSIDRGKEKQNVMAESPSLDQLADRLQELKRLLKHERQELVQVVAEKTMAIKEQEKSIEQLVSELDHMRRNPTPVQHHQMHSTNRLLTPGTISPSSSFSSGCFASTQSDDLSGNPSEKRPPESSAYWHQKPEPSIRQHHVQYPGHKLRSQSFHSHSATNRTRVNGGSDVLVGNQPVPNLLDLSRASEGTGIPLGDLIISKHSIPVKRRTSEARLIHN